ncbi:calpastatin [Aeromicrobium sp. Root236]|uniref:DUF1810 domain-containing protein n=1 Tax=Aeromicrobium sp. Root236 TaxID=1736498 RepID=UPI0006F949CB|nr:DUF1810 domain-containing protein [Aeromicrobium sp. Root236]KRC64545.1 calpastatin [Aeromicrobium sp. Root236]
MTDPYDLQRFVDAQGGGTYDRALAELRAGRKTSHWMWFVFPQVAGLGRSETAVRYALSGVDEARAYGSHPVLGPRYDECCEALVSLGEVSMTDVLGPVDAQKLHSSLTLFAQAGPQGPAVDALLATHFGGELDPATLRLL